MRPRKTFTLILLSVLIVSACSAAPASPSQGLPVYEIYTSAVMTISAAAATTAAAPPAPTSTPQIIPTDLSTPTPFSDTINPLAGNTPDCDKSRYIADVTIPDGTVLSPGEVFTKTWTLQNSGACTWTRFYALAYDSGDTLGGSATALGAAVNPGDTVNISIIMVAPSTAGSYTSYWRLQNASGAPFGDPVYVKIVVTP